MTSPGTTAKRTSTEDFRRRGILRILTVFGTRPEAIKMAPVLRQLSKQSAVESILCVTGQHREMLDQVLNVFGIRPNIDLNLMRTGQQLGSLTGEVVEQLGATLRKTRPDRVLIQGDTTTAMATALASFYERIPVAHVEAGLRTGDMHKPWPEELNRRIATVISDLHFAPTEDARQNLLREGVIDTRISVTGNTVIDALLDTVSLLDLNPDVLAMAQAKLPMLNPAKRQILATGHRRENFGEGLEQVAKGLARIAERGDVEIVYPVHLNPKVQRTVHAILAGRPGVHLVDPLEYLPFVHLMRRATLIITDSGGVQEEAPALGKPVLVTRDVTERPEAVAVGTVELVGTDPAKLVERANRLLDNPAAYASASIVHFPYGDGCAAARILERILNA